MQAWRLDIARRRLESGAFDITPNSDITKDELIAFRKAAETIRYDFRKSRRKEYIGSMNRISGLHGNLSQKDTNQKALEAIDSIIRFVEKQPNISPEQLKV